MEEQVLKNGRVKKILVAVLSVITMFVIYMIITHYIDTHTWARIGSVEEVSADICEVFTHEVEVIKGETIYLSTTRIMIEDIAREGNVTLSFSPAVIDCNNGKIINTVVIKRGESLQIKRESENGDSATATIWVDSLWYY